MVEGLVSKYTCSILRDGELQNRPTITSLVLLICLTTGLAVVNATHKRRRTVLNMDMAAFSLSLEWWLSVVGRRKRGGERGGGKLLQCTLRCSFCLFFIHTLWEFTV